MVNYRSSGIAPIPPVIKNLLIINGLVWLAQLYFDRQGVFLELYGGLWSLGSGNFRVWQLITHMFMHQAYEIDLAAGTINYTPVFAHIGFNMFALWMFGSTLENFWGSKRFLQFYMICGVGAGLAQMLLGGGGYAIGASGAVMGVMAGFAYLFPNTELYMLFIPVPIKAKYVVGGLVALDLFGGINPGQGDNVAHWAHLGGALIGIIVVIFWNKTRKKDFY
jgi:membrane associated rhomboid family serine protease